MALKLLGFPNYLDNMLGLPTTICNIEEAEFITHQGTYCDRGKREAMGRRLSATFLGGLGVVLLVVGLSAFTIVGSVASASAVRNTVESLMKYQSVRLAIADDIVTAIEDSGDTPQEKVVFSLARPLIETAVSRAIDSSRLQEFFGDVSFRAYEVFVDEKPATTVDVSPVIDIAVNAIKKIDPRIAKNFTPNVEPLKLERTAESPDLGTLRNGVQKGTWALLVIGVLLQVAAWFLSTATISVRVLRLGRRIVAVGVGMMLFTLLARLVAPGFSPDNKELVKAIVQFITQPLYVKGTVIAIIGVALAVGGYLGERRTRHGELAPTHGDRSR